MDREKRSEPPVSLIPEADALIKRAEALLGKQKSRKRPLLIEFAGTPKSGKSTCIDSVGHFFHRLGFKVFTPTEGVSRRTPRALKNDLLHYNVWAACYALMQMFEAIHNADRFHIAMFDRGIFDVLAWVDWLHAEKKRINKATRNQIQRFMLLEPWKDQMDLVVLFRSDPATSLARENRNKLLEKSGRAMSPESLATLNEAYGRVLETYKEEFGGFLNVDTSRDESGIEPETRATVVEIVDYVLGLMEAEA